MHRGRGEDVKVLMQVTGRVTMLSFTNHSEQPSNGHRGFWAHCFFLWQGFFPQGFPLAIYHATYILKLDTSVADEDISFNGKGECGRTGA
jgi:hypothetical protein